MTKTVWKYELNSTLNKLHMPVGAQILSAQVQHDVMCMWALVDVDAPKVFRYFEVVGTGSRIVSSNMTHIGTLMMADGHIVLHVFERH